MAWQSRQDQWRDWHDDQRWNEWWRFDHRNDFGGSNWQEEWDGVQEDVVAEQNHGWLRESGRGTGSSSSSSHTRFDRAAALRDPKVPFWIRGSARRLGDVDGNKPEEGNPPYKISEEDARALGLSRPAFQNRKAREHARYLVFGKNPEQYVHYICGRPCLFIVVSFEAAKDAEIEQYFCSKFDIKALVVMSRWGKAPDDTAQKGDGTFCSCMADLVIPFILSNALPEDLLTFIFEEDWRLTERDALLSEMRQNKEWSKGLVLPPDGEFLYEFERNKTVLNPKPEEFLEALGSTREGADYDDFSGVVQDYLPGEPSDAEAAHATMMQALRFAATAMGEEVPSRSPPKDLPNFAHKKIMDVDGYRLARTANPQSRQAHRDIVGMVSLCNQAAEKKCGNLVSMSIQVGRGRDWNGMYGGKPLKYKFSNALLAVSKAGARAMKWYLEKFVKKYDHFDKIMMELCTTGWKTLTDLDRQSLYEAMSGPTHSRLNFPAEFWSATGVEKEPSLGDAIGACYLVPSVGHFCRHFSSSNDKWGKEDFISSWDDRWTGEVLDPAKGQCDYFFLAWTVKNGGWPIFLRNDWAPEGLTSGEPSASQHEERCSWQDDKKRDLLIFRPVPTIWFTRTPPWIHNTNELLTITKGHTQDPNQAWAGLCKSPTSKYTPCDCAETKATVWQKGHADQRKARKAQKEYWTLRNFTWMNKSAMADWRVAKTVGVEDEEDPRRALWRGFVQPRDLAFRELLTREDRLLDTICGHYKTLSETKEFEKGAHPCKSRQDEYDRRHGICRQQSEPSAAKSKWVPKAPAPRQQTPPPPDRRGAPDRVPPPPPTTGRPSWWSPPPPPPDPPALTDGRSKRPAEPGEDEPLAVPEPPPRRFLEPGEPEDGWGTTPEWAGTTPSPSPEPRRRNARNRI